ncbi:MAG: ATP-binding protein [Epsilonproteobacteria bacterium]|nr:MAG: ATP-binding protein [Campylobacterota bacterium]
MNDIIHKEFYWLRALIENRIANHFQDNVKLMDDSRNFDISPSFYEKFIDRYDLTMSEQKVIALALSYYIAPSLLDIFLTKNESTNVPFVEFGGFLRDDFSGFIPTIRTALFLLAGNNTKEYIEKMKLFENSNTLFMKGLLDRSRLRDDISLLDTQLVLSLDSINSILYGKDIEHEYTAKFPAILMKSSYEWEDLILQKHTKEHLLELDMWLNHKDTLLHEWGMDGKVQKGYKALFYGLSGTGKTLTVTLLGKRYNRAVYRISLSQVISKYIGETEKNLEYIFDVAKQRDWILFFDEADSLFSKRTKVSNSNDRYANQQSAYLLQRIEDFSGLVILASNLKDNFDDAFLRRFQTIVYFPLPDRDERLKLWKNGFSKKANLEDIDLEDIAQEYELSGANINNIIRLVSLMTIQRGDTKISQEDIVTGIKREKYKEGKII